MYKWETNTVEYINLGDRLNYLRLNYGENCIKFIINLSSNEFVIVFETDSILN